MAGRLINIFGIVLLLGFIAIPASDVFARPADIINPRQKSNENMVDKGFISCELKPAFTRMPTGVTAFIGTSPDGEIEEPVQIYHFEEFYAEFGYSKLEYSLGDAVKAFFREGGKEAIILRLDPSNGDSLTYDDFFPKGGSINEEGIYALDQGGPFDLMCIPPFEKNSHVNIPVMRTAVEYCEERSAMLLIDPPSSWISVDRAINEVEEAGGHPLGIDSPNAAIFFPPPKSGESICGAVAGIYARMDEKRNVWKSPAGVDPIFNTVGDLLLVLTNNDIDRLTPYGINAIKKFPGTGTVIWGARTMSSDPDWRYVAVRRFHMFLEHSIEEGTEWAVFEPNDANLWAKLRSQITTFMDSLFKDGAFAGITPREAYYVKCGLDTTTEDEIEDGILNVLIGYAPIRAEEFTILQIQLAFED